MIRWRAGFNYRRQNAGSPAFWQNLVLSRKITCKYDENKIFIQNTVENLSFRKEMLMPLFHYNMSYPLLDEDALFISPTEKLIPRGPEAEKVKALYQLCQQSTPNYSEQVFYHNLKSDQNGNTSVAVVNKSLSWEWPLISIRTSFSISPSGSRWAKGNT